MKNQIATGMALQTLKSQGRSGRMDGLARLSRAIHEAIRVDQECPVTIPISSHGSSGTTSTRAWNRGGAKQIISNYTSKFHDAFERQKVGVVVLGSWWITLQLILPEYAFFHHFSILLRISKGSDRTMCFRESFNSNFLPGIAETTGVRWRSQGQGEKIYKLIVWICMNYLQ